MRTVSDWKQTEGQSHLWAIGVNGSMGGSNPSGQGSNPWSPVSVMEFTGHDKIMTQDNKSENKHLRNRVEISLDSVSAQIAQLVEH